MIEVTCIEKFRDKNGKIIKYRLQDTDGIFRDIEPEMVKEFIKTKTIHVSNLKLTSDNRIIDSYN